MGLVHFAKRAINRKRVHSHLMRAATVQLTHTSKGEVLEERVHLFKEKVLSLCLMSTTSYVDVLRSAGLGPIGVTVDINRYKSKSTEQRKKY